MIRARGVTVTISGRRVQDGVDLDVAPGEAVGLVGPNGAGKTMLLRALLGLVRYRGRVEIGGIDLARDPIAARSLVGFMPQTAAFGEESARDALAFVASLRGRRVYERAGCKACHGDTGRGDGPSSATLRDARNRAIPARDYTKGLFLGGDSAEALYMRFRTGMDGTPMPSFVGQITEEDSWDLVHYMRSLRRDPEPMPSDPVARGRRVVGDRQCRGCHVIEGQGAEVGPSLDVAARKLRYDWVRDYLRDPVAAGHIYPYMTYRMPNLGLSADEIDGVVALFASLAGRPVRDPPAVTRTFDEGLIASGTLLYFLKCTECHNMGDVIPTPEAKRQGPDLILASRRLRFEWLPTWVNNPRTEYPTARMVDTNLTPAEIEAVTAFVWKTRTSARTEQAWLE